ncbi:hypothetical protein [Paraburkholderia tropica]|uniref:hypothetical protein n=1 Tax=Paraburkholderia tropica TaxID=92647 RepID=UPI002ABDCB2F|nr:hypothetical protein [Paraburkholderia tropica]
MAIGMWLTRPGAVALGLTVAIAALFVLFLVLSRDTYVAPTVPALWCYLAGALLLALVCERLLRDTRKPLENPLKHALGSCMAGAAVGVILVMLILDLLVFFSAHQPHAGSVNYEVTSGWKNCRFGVAFEDPVLQHRITVCGTRWRLPDVPRAGVLHITERSGPYGVVLQQVTIDIESSK